MRPRRLELEGFTAFREHVEVEFDDSDLFVLTGPTGSGKSSLIDAMTFALYGSVPRYGDAKLVAPVISQGKLEARVRFDFSIGQLDYSAVRVVRRRSGADGAVTKEARLQCGHDVVAGSARELDAAVEKLLGLSFDQFTTCVVLPQGEFARFLNEKPAQRQDLLIRLLGIGMYREMGAAARARNASEKDRAGALQGELDQLVDLDNEAITAAREREKLLEGLKKRADKARPTLEKLETERKSKEAEVQRIRAEVERLEALKAPKDLDKVLDALERARKELKVAQKSSGSAEKLREAKEQARAPLGEAAPLESAKRDHAANASEKGKLARAQQKLAVATKQSATLKKDLEAARRSCDVATAELESTRQAHAAHALAEHLVVGEPCPVCLVPVRELPAHELPPEQRAAETRLKEARDAQRLCDEAHRGAELTRENAQAVVSQLQTRIAEIEERLTRAPDAIQVERALHAISEAEADLKKAQAAEREAQKAEKAARERLAKLEGDLSGAWRSYDTARDKLSALNPPVRDSEDLASSWRDLIDWARALVPAHRAAAESALALAQEAETERSRKLSELGEQCDELDVELEGRDIWDAIVATIADAKSELKRIDDDLKRAKRLRREIKQSNQRAAVASTLARHLRADGFERWLLEAAVQRLASGASVVLRELSKGQYSFAYDERLNFEVVDHRNADERRSAKTLSGGETFLASLALALTLADQVADLAAEGSSRLESVFLDEGFGSLDPDTLDTVTTAIEELGSRGRVVGIITHVADLAERIPVQYRVSKGPSTSTVDRVVS